MPFNRVVPVAAALLIIVGVAGARGESVDGGKDAVSQAKALFETGRWPEYRRGIELLARYVKDRPDATDAVEAYALQVLYSTKLNRFDDAKRVLLAGTKRHPALDKRPALHRALAEVALRMHKPEKELDHAWRAVELYVEAGDKKTAVEFLFALPREFQRYFANPQARTEAMSNEQLMALMKAQYKRASALSNKAYDRIVELDVDEDTTIKALFQKADALSRPLDDADAWQRAVATWRKIIDEHPHHPKAPEAAFKLAQLYERPMRRYAEAIRQYEELTRRFPDTRWAHEAKGRARMIQQPSLRLRACPPVLPGTKAEIPWVMRNVKSVELRAYKVDLLALLEEYARPRNFYRWQPPDRADAAWTLRVPDDGTHQTYGAGQDGLAPTRLPVTLPGAYLVVASGPMIPGRRTPYRSQTLVLVSRLAVLLKTGRERELAWMVDAVTGRTQPGAELLVLRYLGQRKQAWERAKADNSGLYCPAKGGRRGPGAEVGVVARIGDDCAVVRDTYSQPRRGRERPYLVYGFTDRAVYRPGQTVRFKQIIRKHDQGRYQVAAHETVRVAVGAGSRAALPGAGRKRVFERSLTTNADGTVSGEFKLPHDLPRRTYGINVRVGKHTYGSYECWSNQFLVAPYEKPDRVIEIVPDGPHYRVGDEMRIAVTGKDGEGRPLVGAEVEYEIYRRDLPDACQLRRPYPWYFERQGYSWQREWARNGRKPLFPRIYPMRSEAVKAGRSVTDDRGTARIEPIPVTPYAGSPTSELWYSVLVRVTGKDGRATCESKWLRASQIPFRICLRPERRIYRPGENTRVDVVAVGSDEQPVAFDGEIGVYQLTSRLVEKHGWERPVFEQGDRIVSAPLKVGKDGRATFVEPIGGAGPVRVVASTKTPSGRSVSGHCDLWIVPPAATFDHHAYREIELILDRDWYEVGQALRVLVNTRQRGSTVILTGETDRVLFHRTVSVKGNSAVVDIPIEPDYAPNLHVLGATFHEGKVYESRWEAIVAPTDRFIAVGVLPAKTVYAPGEKAQVAITARDRSGGPIRCELAVMLADVDVDEIQPSFHEPIEKAFYGQRRPLVVRTRSSFAYEEYSRFHEQGRRVLIDCAPWDHPSESTEAQWKRQREAAMLAARTRPAASLPTSRRTSGRRGLPLTLQDKVVQKRFVDPAVWSAHIESDAEGRATFDFVLPEQPGRWRLTVVACDRQGRVGERTIELATRSGRIPDSAGRRGRPARGHRSFGL